MNATDVVEWVCRQARTSLWCPPPPRAVLRRIARYVADKAAQARGALMTVALRQLQLPRRVHATRCVAVWLGLEDCVYILMRGKIILRRDCVRQKLGLT